MYNILQEPVSSIENWLSEIGWHYYVALLYGVFFAYYIFTLKCKNCGKKQIWRSNNIFDFRLPNDNCWDCGEKY
jgi:uncharacterized membrane protein